jgi:hypothetical protein
MLTTLLALAGAWVALVVSVALFTLARLLHRSLSRGPMRPSGDGIVWRRGRIEPTRLVTRRDIRRHFGERNDG